MNFGSVFHRTSLNDCYALNENDLIINLSTGYDVDRVELVFGDPFEAGILGSDEKWVGERVEVSDYVEFEYIKRWTITIQPSYKRVKYYFRLYSGDELFLYFEDGFYPEEILETNKALQCFTNPWMNPSDINRTPDWVKDTIWYQIFPDRFNRVGSSEGFVEWGSRVPSNDDVYGGNLRGVIEKIPYLKTLGITGIYLTPIFHASSTHKYDTIDYYEIDPIFGNKDDFRELITIAHNHNIRIMIDGVFNHCGSDFPYWKDVLAKGPESSYYDWFMINHWPLRDIDKGTHNGDFFSFAFHAGMPKLNTNNEEVIKYFVNVCKYWIREFDIDGIRLDVANEVSHQFNKTLRKELLKVKPDIYILGEIWHDAIPWLLGDEYDAVMNYPLTNAITNFWNENQTSKQFAHAIEKSYSNYMEQTNRVMFNLLDSHDTNRLYNKVKNIDIFYQQLTILFSMQGSPSIFYGTEIATEGGHDPYCRICMPWNEIDAGNHDARIKKMQELSWMRNLYSCTKHKDIHFKDLYENDRVLVYEKMDEKSHLRFILNESDIEIEVEDHNIVFSNAYENGYLRKHGTLVINLFKS